MMHIVMVVLGGLVALAVFYFASGLTGRPGSAGAVLFILVWLVASLLNSAVGVFRAGIPVINEAGAFLLIFGIPAGAAWYLASRYGATR